MKRPKFTEEQIITILREPEAGDRRIKVWNAERPHLAVLGEGSDRVGAPASDHRKVRGKVAVPVFTEDTLPDLAGADGQTDAAWTQRDLTEV